MQLRNVFLGLKCLKLPDLGTEFTLQRKNVIDTGKPENHRLTSAGWKGMFSGGGPAMQRQNMWQSWEDWLKFESGCVFLEDRSGLGRALGTAGCGGFFWDLVMIVRFLFESFKSMFVAKLTNT